VSDCHDESHLGEERAETSMKVIFNCHVRSES
jgi:hypothetical protein